MRRSIPLFLFLFACLLSPRAATAPSDSARQAFEADRFGVFLHWGLYSLFAQGEWYLQNAELDHGEYAKAADAFYPHRFDARAWVSAIKASGARYITLTTRHHDGFSLWATEASPYNVVQATPFGRDILRELADECRRQGLRLHLYYSLIDWTREDYPMGRTGRATGKDPQRADYTHYLHFMERQLTELLTHYGPIGAIWFDGYWDHDSDTRPFPWQLDELYGLIHHLQPHCLVANNHHEAPHEGEDIQVFERDVPGENHAGLSGQSISRLPLETCQTMNGMWGYKVADQDYKRPEELIRLLVRTAGKGANLLLNIGPQPNGELPAEALARLQKLGQWTSHYGPTIYATQGRGIEGDWGTTTRRGDTLFVHVLDPKATTVFLPGAQVRHARAFRGTLPVKSESTTAGTVLSFPPRGESDDVDFVITAQERR